MIIILISCFSIVVKKFLIDNAFRLAKKTPFKPFSCSPCISFWSMLAYNIFLYGAEGIVTGLLMASGCYILTGFIVALRNA